MDLVDKQRTIAQNRSLHLYFTLLAEELNKAGYDMQRTLANSVDIQWNATTIKECLWKPIQNAQLMKRSTTDLTTKEIDLVYDTLTRHLGETTGVSVEFPSQDTDGVK